MANPPMALKTIESLNDRSLFILYFIKITLEITQEKVILL